MTRVALIGLGEVGRVFAEDLVRGDGDELVAWDIAFGDPGSAASMNATALGITTATSAAGAVAGAELAISAVTAAHCSAAAQDAAVAIAPGCWFFDLSSSSPTQKRTAQQGVDAVGARYVEAALMSPIGPSRLGSPFLLGGPHAVDFAASASRWGFTDVTVFSDQVGAAAATKLCRSVIVKGLESLLTESLLAARSYGVERQVLDSLSNILPPADWEVVAGYFLSRSLLHGQRRSEEMLEAGATVADTGIEPVMALATARRQAWAAQHSDALTESEAGTMSVLDHILRSVHDQQQDPAAGEREPA